METTIPQIPGWGADLDHANRPAYPKERIPARLEVPWDDPEKQIQKVEVLKSVEHVRMPPVFGTSTPPSGLSGVIRRVAFKWSEGDLRHWLLLLMADRVNVVEGIFADLSRGHIPNIFAEMGWKSAWKYNRRGVVKKIAITAVVAAAAIYLLTRED